jgi:hypothetical protein
MCVVYCIAVQGWTQGKALEEMIENGLSFMEPETAIRVKFDLLILTKQESKVLGGKQNWSLTLANPSESPLQNVLIL